MGTRQGLPPLRSLPKMLTGPGLGLRRTPKPGEIMGTTDKPTVPISEASIPLDRDVFLRTLIRELSGSLQEVVGLEEASGFVSVVGQRMGEQINASYKAALAVQRLNRAQVAEVLVDLK